MKIFRVAAAALGLGLGMAQTCPAQEAAAPAVPSTAEVLVTLTVKAGISRDQIAPVMPREVRETVQMYLDGHIQQWYGRSDGKGVVFIMNCASVAEAKALMESLPLYKNHLVDLDYMALGPLTPLRGLLGPAAAKPAQ
jgi:hypothetical protein